MHSIRHLCSMRWLLPCAAPSHMGASHSLVPGHWWTRAVRTWTQWRTRRRLCWCPPPKRGQWRKASGRWSDPTAHRWWTYWWHRPSSGCWWSYLHRHQEGYYWSISKSFHCQDNNIRNVQHPKDKFFWHCWSPDLTDNPTTRLTSLIKRLSV